MTKFEKETRNQLYTFLKNQLLTYQNVGQQRTLMTRSVHLHRHEVLTVP